MGADVVKDYRRARSMLGVVPQELVFLDEPTTGLDPQTRANLWTHIRGLRDRRDGTILLTTHYLEEAERMADRIVLMDRGRVLADDTLAGFRERAGHDGGHGASLETVFLSLTGRTLRD